MSKKKKKKLDEGMVMMASLLPVGDVIGFLPKRVDNFKFKGLPGQFDKDGNKILDEYGQSLPLEVVTEGMTGAALLSALKKTQVMPKGLDVVIKVGGKEYKNVTVKEDRSKSQLVITAK
jgi:hypothetical protein